MDDGTSAGFHQSCWPVGHSHVSPDQGLWEPCLPTGLHVSHATPPIAGVTIQHLQLAWPRVVLTVQDPVQGLIQRPGVSTPGIRSGQGEATGATDCPAPTPALRGQVMSSLQPNRHGLGEQFPPSTCPCSRDGFRSGGSGLGRGASGADCPLNWGLRGTPRLTSLAPRPLGSWPECCIPCLERAPRLVSFARPAVRLVPRASCCHVPSPVAPAVLPSALGGGPLSPRSKKVPPLPTRVVPSPAVASHRRGGRPLLQPHLVPAYAHLREISTCLLSEYLLGASKAG